MEGTTDNKNSSLSEILRGMGRVMVAFSGGVDSALVLKRAQQELGQNVIAVIVASETFRDQEFNAAVKLAQDMGVQVYKTEIKELDNADFVANTPDSWYHSKVMLYSHLKELAKELDYPYVLDGMIMDDLQDFRPGLKARTEQGVRSPLQEAEFYKDEVRELAKKLGIPVWNKPASCSLASRIPYGSTIDLRKIQQVNNGELFLTELGVKTVRVRHHDNIARIEVAPDDIAKILEHREVIQDKFMELGFNYVALDLQGYRMGSMNEVLASSAVTELHQATA